MGKRIKSNEKGVAFIFIILGIMILVMLCLILVPMFMDGGEATAKESDKAHEQTVYDSAYMKFCSSGSFTAIYDYSNKKFVTGAAAKRVEPYGESEEHKGQVILVTAYTSGEIKTQWVVPKVV